MTESQVGTCRSISFISVLVLLHTHSCPSLSLPSIPGHRLLLSLYLLTVSCLWRLLILLSVFKEAHHSDRPWPFISARTDRQHSLRWKAHRKGREAAGRRQYGYTKKNMWLEKPMNVKRDKRAGSHSPGELPCLGKQAPALARRKTCQGLICVFVHRCASKRTWTSSQDHQKSAIVEW